jgi:hypothetical protein
VRIGDALRVLCGDIDWRDDTADGVGPAANESFQTRSNRFRVNGP